ncbi:hypothetical protein [Haladaptatus sp. DFWS20]|uniref:hypothetical protein n=1 Tax=Haladaptatus sp. DFWS20 TaxID=3403467 RepID=UPI003EBE9E4C
MARQLVVSDITDQQTLTESANTATDDTPERNTQQHAADIAAEYVPGRLGLSPRVKNNEPKECNYEDFSGIS